MDYADIVFAHCPDENVPMAETVRAFNFLIDTGKTFYWGTSGWSAAQIEEAHSTHISRRNLRDRWTLIHVLDSFL